MNRLLSVFSVEENESDSVLEIRLLLDGTIQKVHCLLTYQHRRRSLAPRRQGDLPHHQQLFSLFSCCHHFVASWW